MSFSHVPVITIFYAAYKTLLVKQFLIPLIEKFRFTYTFLTLDHWETLTMIPSAARP